MTTESLIEKNLKKIRNIQQVFYPTPLLEITIKYKGKALKVYAKSEVSTFSGSVKDRVVSHILEKSYLSGSLKPNDRIIEVTSGCTGIALTALCGFLGHKVKILIPNWFSKARYAMLEIMGAQIHKISRAEGGFMKCLKIASEKNIQEGYFYLNQFNNELNIDAHFCSTAPELFNSLKMLNNKFVFSAGVGTGGTIIGIHKYCLENKIDCLCFAMEPESSPLLSSKGKKIGVHRIEGIADDFVPKNCDLDSSLFEEIISIADGDAILMTQKLNKFGFAVGISSGGNFLAALKAAEKHDFTRIPLTIFPDGSLKYTSTDLFRIEPMRDGYLANNIEVVDINILSDKQF